MSRCFPYPPPYYGQAQIESIKLQRKIESSTKKEEREKSRKKHKREDKQKLKSSDTDVRNRKTSEEKKRKMSKHEENLLLQNKYAQKISNEVTEHLERSGLTEDHELPCSTQYNFDSPESSLDSSKRRKVAPCVSIHKTHGTILRIKLPSSKQNALVQPLLSRQMESDPQFTLSRTRKPDLPFLLSRPSKPEMSLPSTRQVKPEQPLTSLRQVKPEQALSTSRQTKSKLSWPPPSREVELKLPLPSARQVKSKLALPSAQIKSELPVPSSSQMKSDPPLPLSSQVKSELLLPSSRQAHLELPLPSLRQRDSHKLFMQITKPIVKVQSVADEQPCPSGRGEENTLGQEASVSLHKTSSSKKTRSKDWQNEEFRELTVNWKALALQADSLDIDDQWLMEAPKRDTSHANEFKTSTEALACRNYEMSSQQSRAYYVAEFDMYQLPYVLPY